MSGQHAVLSPSSAHRWIPCPGSIPLSAGIPNESSFFADEGTHAHALAAHLLENKPIEEFIFDERFDKEETISYTQVYVDEIFRSAEGKMLLTEQTVSVEKYTSEPGGSGTSDAIIVDLLNNYLEIHDLKFGKGHVVDADNNEQMMLYALGAIDLVEDIIGGKFETIKMVIHQPRRDHISTYITTRERLDQFGKYSETRGRLARSLKPGEELHPSPDACQWCPAGRAGKCPAVTQEVKVAVFSDFDDLTVNDPAKMEKPPSPQVIDLVEGWVAAAKERISNDLHSGKKLDDWKLIAGKKGNRYFNDQEKAVALLDQLGLKEKAYTTPELLSAAQIEKIVPKKKWLLFEDIIGQADAKAVVAPRSHSKPEFVSTAAVETFEDLSGDLSDLL